MNNQTEKQSTDSGNEETIEKEVSDNQNEEENQEVIKEKKSERTSKITEIEKSLMQPKYENIISILISYPSEVESMFGSTMIYKVNLINI